MTQLDRRQFLKTTAAAAAVAASAHVAHAAEEEKKPVRIAVMGVNGRGRQLIPLFKQFPHVEVAYICEPDDKVIEYKVAPAKQLAGLRLDKQEKPAAYIKDFRQALDDPSVDVLVVSAPDHWHALATVLACQAGKDVYVEKPASHNLIEGRRMVEAARKYGRVVQVGTQRRSGQDMQEAVEIVRSGRLGDVNYARCWINSQRPSIGKVEPSDPPAYLDFNLWAGPGSAPYRRNLLHYHWHWRWEFGTGECGNNGIHALDIARWGLGVSAPHTIACGGGKYFFDDDQETPDSQFATFDFDNCCITWEHRTWSPRGIEGSAFGVVFYGSKGTLVTDGDGYRVYDEKDKEVENRKPTGSQSQHVENFLNCLVTRDKPNADIEIGHESTRLCHLANIAFRTRSTLRFDAATETIAGNDAANALLGREYRKGFELPKV